MATSSLRTVLSSLLLIAAAFPLPAQQQTTEHIRDDPAAREEYLRRQRAYPFERIPPNALRNARLEASRMLSGAPAFGANIASSWTSIGPAAIATTPTNSGRVTAIAVGAANALYVGAAQGGVWKSTNGGASWTPLLDNQCSLAVGAITVDPVNPQIVYVGTGEPNFSGDSYYGCGVLRSTDGGDTWTQLGGVLFQTGTGGARIAKILIDPATAGTTAATLYAATSFGFYRSTDGGTTWTRTLYVGYGYVTDIVIDPAVPTTLFAAASAPYTNTANGIYKSTDAGLTWVKLAGGLPTTEVGRIAMTMAPRGANTMYVAIEGPSSGNLSGMYKSADRGVSWTQVAATGVSCSSQCWYNMAINVDPTDETVVYFSGFSLYRSTSGGAGFSNIGGAIHVDHHALAFDPQMPSVIYAGSDGGIFRSGDAGATWTSLNANLAITQFYAGVSLHPTDVFPILGGTQDNGTLQFTGNAAWPPIFGGDGGFTATNPLSPNTTYVETQWASGSGYSGPRRRDTPTGSYQLKTNGIALNDPALFIPPLVINAALPHHVYFGTNRLWRSMNNADSWTAISTVIPRTGGSVSAIAPSASDSLVVYVGASDGTVRVTTDGGDSWTLAVTGLPNRYISDFVVNPAHPEIAYVSVSGFGTPHVFKTVDRGANWTSISGNLPDVPVNALTQIPGGDLFVGTDLGVFRTSDGGVTWSKPAGGLPNIAVFDLVFGDMTNTLVAATHGRSMFSLGVTPIVTPTQLLARASSTVGQVGVPLPPIQVSIRETAGYIARSAAIAVTATAADGGAPLSGTTTVNAVNGVATFSNLVVGAPSGVQRITFTAAGLDPASVVVTTTTPVSLALSVASRRDEVPNGVTTPRPDSATVTLGGNGDASSTPWTATKTKSWTTLVTDAGTGSGVLRWTRNPAGLSAGTYVDTISVVVLGAAGSPARLVDTLVVLPPAAYAYFRPDTIRGTKTEKVFTDLVADVSSLGGVLVGSYASTVTWDSSVVRLDSVRAVPSGFAPPTVNQVNGGEVRLASADATGKGGAAALARLWFHFESDTIGRQSALVSTFSELTSTTGTNLAASMQRRPGTAVVYVGVLRGDVTADGVVRAADAQAVLQAVVGLSLPSGFKAMPNGDANCSGSLQAVDAQVILAFVVGLPVTQFCVGTVR